MGVDLLQSQRIELEITRRVVLVVDLGQAVGIDGRRQEEDGGPVRGRYLAQTAVEEGRSTVGIVNEGGQVEGGGELLVEQLREGPTGSGEHGQALRVFREIQWVRILDGASISNAGNDGKQIHEMHIFIFIIHFTQCQALFTHNSRHA